mgnify:FL=1
MKKYIVRIYFTKFLDVEVEASSAEEAVDNADVPYLDWYDKHDTSMQPITLFDVKEPTDE